MVVIPSPSQSPVTGIQPGCPNVKLTSVDSVEDSPLRGSPARACPRCSIQVPVSWSYTPTLVVPSPFQSPVTGNAPGRPNVKTWSAGPEVPSRRPQGAVWGSKAPAETLPSPSQSPDTARSG